MCLRMKIGEVASSTDRMVRPSAGSCQITNFQIQVRGLGWDGLAGLYGLWHDVAAHGRGPVSQMVGMGLVDGRRVVHGFGVRTEVVAAVVVMEARRTIGFLNEKKGKMTFYVVRFEKRPDSWKPKRPFFGVK